MPDDSLLYHSVDPCGVGVNGNISVFQTEVASSNLVHRSKY